MQFGCDETLLDEIHSALMDLYKAHDRGMMFDFFDQGNQSKDFVEVRCQDALSLMRSLDADSVNLVLTDPPYGISYQSNWSEKKTKPILGDWNFQFGPFLREISRVLVSGGVAYIFTRWDVYPMWYTSISESGLTLKNLIVWDKDNHSSGDLKGNFGFKWEGIMMLTKGRHHLRGHRHSNVWSFPRVPHKKSRHPAEKPVPLLQRAIEASTDKGDLVVDPFCGSGSTAEAASLLGRRVLVGDTDTQCVLSTKKRLGLPYDLSLEAPKTDEDTPPMPDEVEIDLSALDGVHPEDIALMLQDWKSSHKND